MLENGQMSALCYGPTMDSQLIRQLFGDVLELCRLLELELPWRSDMEMKLDGLPPTCIGGDGRIMEWSEPYAEWEPGHRHISHLYGLYPGYEIDSRSGRLFEAARNTLEGRLAHGGGHTGWSRAWIINLWARLQDGEKALENVRALLTHSTETNLFDMHPPFQIDGNFGGTAGIAEMLLQSKMQYPAAQNQPSDSRPQGVDNRNRPGDEQGSMGQQVHIHLLPALPMRWSQGSFRGLKARGNIEVSAEWQDGQVSHVTLSSPLTQRVRMTANGSTRDIHLEGGNTTVLEL